MATDKDIKNLVDQAKDFTHPDHEIPTKLLSVEERLQILEDTQIALAEQVYSAIQSIHATLNYINKTPDMEQESGDYLSEIEDSLKEIEKLF